ncbi:unnamed protein product [Coregonus sp. 'balchen']|nr:unnamed protein product [Coregonus sp. 'balchen']
MKRSVYEGDDLTIDCTHNLPVGLRNLLVFVWLKDNHCLEGENNSNLTLKRVVTKTNGIYVCTIQSPCGNFTSDSREIKVEELTVVILVICGVSVSMCVRTDGELTVVIIVICGVSVSMCVRTDGELTVVIIVICGVSVSMCVRTDGELTVVIIVICGVSVSMCVRTDGELTVVIIVICGVSVSMCVRTDGELTVVIIVICGVSVSMCVRTDGDLTMLTIVICGVSAVVLILVLGIGMKIMLKKEFAKTKNRRQQNAQNLQSTTTTE